MEQKTQIFRTVSKYIWTMVKQSHQRRSGVFVNFEYISHIFLVLLLLTLNK